MYCPDCAGKTRVLRTRHCGNDLMFRIRICRVCERVFRTEERMCTLADEERAAAIDTAAENLGLWCHMAHVPHPDERRC